MKIPSSIRIAGVDYAVEEVAYLNNGCKIANGHIDFERCTIELSSIRGCNYQQQCITFLHEVLHGIIDAYDLEIDNEEQVVETLGKGLYMVLQDNGRKLFDIVSEEENK